MTHKVWSRVPQALIMLPRMRQYNQPKSSKGSLGCCFFLTLGAMHQRGSKNVLRICALFLIELHMDD